MSSIPLSKKHGVYPSLMVCIICGESTGIALRGRLPNDEKAPRKAVYEVEPCDDCKKKYLEDGVMLVEAEMVDVRVWKGGQYQYVQRPVPNGTLSVLKTEAFKKVFNKPVPEGRIAFVEIGLLTKIGAV